MRKTYKNFEKEHIGSSDIGGLILAGIDNDGYKLEELAFGSDGTYEAYIVDQNDVEISKHYELMHTFNIWLKIYDDEELVKTFYADEIRIYRSGEFGCIIHLIKKEVYNNDN